MIIIDLGRTSEVSMQQELPLTCSPCSSVLHLSWEMSLGCGMHVAHPGLPAFTPPAAPTCSIGIRALRSSGPARVCAGVRTVTAATRAFSCVVRSAMSSDTCTRPSWRESLGRKGNAQPYRMPAERKHGGFSAGQDLRQEQWVFPSRSTSTQLGGGGSLACRWLQQRDWTNMRLRIRIWIQETRGSEDVSDCQNLLTCAVPPSPPNHPTQTSRP